ncbi:retention module-containing protein, partial [Undibacterium baiyunense]
MANSANIIGKVVALQGQAFIKSPDGKQHQLKVGDVVYEKDIIITAPGAQVELAFDSGHNYLVRQNETVTLDASVFAPSQSDIAKAALLPADANQQNVAKAIIGGDSLDQLLEETAAGLGGGEVSDGNSFVRVGRIAENVTPVNIAAATTTTSTTQTQQEAPPVVVNAVPNVISVSSPSSGEGTSQDFIVELSAPSTQTIQLNLSLSSGSATLGVDTSTQFVSFNGGQSFIPFSGGGVDVPAGVTSVIVRVNTVNDGLIEGNENFSLTASTSSNVSVVSGSGSIVDAAAPVLSISGPIEVSESTGVVTFTVSLNSASTATVSVNYATANGSAVAGSDFTPVAGNIVFAPGETTKTISVPITADRIFENLENFSVNLSNPSNALIGSGSTSVNIRDEALVVSSISSPTVNEGGSLVFDVSLSGVSNTDTEVSVSLASGSAILGVDTGVQEYSVDGGGSWRPFNGVVLVPPGSIGFQVRVATLTDNLIEGRETISLSGATSQNTSPIVGTGTIVDGTVLSVNISGPTSVNEGVGSVSYTISLSGSSTIPVSVNYQSSDGTALNGSDYGAVSGSVTFEPGETTKVITVNIANDSIFEGPENFNVSLSGVVNATIGNGSVTTTIFDDGTGFGGNDDDRVTVSSVSSPSVSEGGDLIFTVNLSGKSSNDTSVSVSASSGTAILGVDTSEGQEFSLDGGLSWNPLSGSIVVPAGVDSFQVKVSTKLDGILEGDETISLSAATAQNASSITGIGTIIDGAVPSISVVGPASINESAGTVTYTVSLSSASIATVNVNFATNNGSAISGSDFVGTSGTISFAPGETTKTVVVLLINDSIEESTENFTFNLSNAVNATIGNASLVTTIIDDDRPTITTVEPGAAGPAGDTVVEGNNLVYTVSLSGPTTIASTYSYNLGGGTATAGSD